MFQIHQVAAPWPFQQVRPCEVDVAGLETCARSTNLGPVLAVACAAPPYVGTAASYLDEADDARVKLKPAVHATVFSA